MGLDTRPRSWSGVLSGRFGGNDFEFDVVSSCEGARVVARHMFLELLPTSDNLVDCDAVSSCGSDHASETTTANSLGENWSVESEDDFEADSELLCRPPGTFVSLRLTPPPGTHLPVSNLGAKKESVRSTSSVWGSKKKNDGDGSFTTVVIKNLPESCTNEMVLDLLNSAGFSGKYDFVYVPTDFRDFSAFGYAFINMTTHHFAQAAIDSLQGTRPWQTCAELDVDWSMPHQGLAVHVRRYRNSPVMHPGVPDKYKPLLFRHGVVQRFPEPTKRIKEPRLRRGSVPGTPPLPTGF